MKKVKYLIVIILICIAVFIGIEIFRNVEIDNSENTTNNIIDTDGEIKDEEATNDMLEQENSTQNNETQVEIQNGQELLEKAEKILSARGWAGASNNILGIKDNVLYYYDKGTGEFRKIATGIEDIYYKTDSSEEITAKKGNNAEILTEEFNFLLCE